MSGLSKGKPSLTFPSPVLLTYAPYTCVTPHPSNLPSTFPLPLPTPGPSHPLSVGGLPNRKYTLPVTTPNRKCLEICVSQELAMQKYQYPSSLCP